MTTPNPNPEDDPSQPSIRRDPLSGMPYIECLREAPTNEQLTPDRVAEILLQQEAAWHLEANRQ